ncbi:MAG: peptidylprolyl isomerase [Planctomycetota bacterium]
MLTEMLSKRIVVGGLLLATVLMVMPAVWAADGDALVIINGRPISRKKVVDMLMESRGLQIMQQLIALELAKQETGRRGIEVTAADVQAQFRRAVNEIIPERDANGVAMDEAQKEHALQLFLQQKCLTRPEFEVAMERNAHLRKVVEQEFRVDEATLREEFARTYGARVEVRHIQFNAGDTTAVNEALDLLSRGVEFAEVARRVSVNTQTAANGGLMAPFTFEDETIPAALRETAFSLEAGQRSNPTLVGNMIHILQLERRIPPAEVRFEDVRSEVEARLRQRVVHQRMNELISDLFRQAQIRVLDPKLKREFEKMLSEQAAGGVPTR